MLLPFQPYIKRLFNFIQLFEKFFRKTFLWQPCLAYKYFRPFSGFGQFEQYFNFFGNYFCMPKMDNNFLWKKLQNWVLPNKASKIVCGKPLCRWLYFKTYFEKLVKWTSYFKALEKYISTVVYTTHEISTRLF